MGAVMSSLALALSFARPFLFFQAAAFFALADGGSVSTKAFEFTPATYLLVLFPLAFFS